MTDSFEPEVAAGVCGLAAAYGEGSARPAAVLETYLARIEQANPAIHAFVDLDVEGARDAALTRELDDAGAAAPALDILSFRHETQYTRLFRS